MGFYITGRRVAGGGGGGEKNKPEYPKASPKFGNTIRGEQCPFHLRMDSPTLVKVNLVRTRRL